MKNIPFFIILVSQYLFTALMLDIISHDGLVHGAIFLGISLILIFAISLIYKKKFKPQKESIWTLFKKIAPTAVSAELIILFLLRLCIIMNI